MLAVLPLTVAPLSVSVPPWLYRPPPHGAVLPVTVQSVSVSVPPVLYRPPPRLLAWLLVTVQLVSVTGPPLVSRPPPLPALPLLIVSPDSGAEPPLMSNARLALLPLIVSRSAAGPSIVTPAGSVSVSWPLVRVIVCGVVPNTLLSKSIVSATSFAFAWVTAHGRVPWVLTSSSVLLTVYVASSVRSSSAVTVGRSRRLRPAALSPPSGR